MLQTIKDNLPNLADPRNELVVYAGWLMAALNAIRPLISEDTFTTNTGIVTFLIAVVSLIVRSQVSSKGTVAQLIRQIEKDLSHPPAKD